MDYNNDFKFDLVVGQMKEMELGSILQGKTIEVKSDKLAHKTGNVFIEYQSRGKASGIATTEADYYAIEIQGSYVILSSDKLKEKCRKYFKTDRDTVGGDSDTSKGILLPVTDLF